MTVNNISSVNSDEIIGRHENCAPGVSSDNLSCMQITQLVGVAKAYNMDNPNSEIKLTRTLGTLNPRKYKKHLLKELGSRLSKTCSTQKCWTEQKFIRNMEKIQKDELVKYTFRPKGPKGKFAWLSTFNIDDVMTQYENVYHDFKYLGTVPMDFDSLPSTGIRDMDFKKLYSEEGVKKIGMVLNLDEHDKSGSHWVATYSDLELGQVYYFDSYGTSPEKRVRAFMRRVARDCKNINQNIKVNADHNKIRHQFKNSECGVYSMNFIIRMLKGEGFKNITETITTDDQINEFRNIYFAKK